MLYNDILICNLNEKNGAPNKRNMNMASNFIYYCNINNLESYMYMHFRSNHCQVNAYQLPEIGWQQIQKVLTINWACVSTYDRQNLRKNCAQDIHCTFKHTSPRSDIVVILNTNIRVIMYVHGFFSVYHCFTWIPNLFTMLY